VRTTAGAFCVLWDDPEWQKSHQDADSARAEQRAAKDYRERQEKAQRAKDLSTHAAINGKFAVGDYLASQPGEEYTEAEKKTQKFWDIMEFLQMLVFRWFRLIYMGPLSIQR
jgi:hypothetical protein